MQIYYKGNNAFTYMRNFEQRKHNKRAFKCLARDREQATDIFSENILKIFYLNENGVKSKIVTYMSEFL